MMIRFLRQSAPSVLTTISMMLIVLLGVLFSGHSVGALSNNPKLYISGDNAFYLYVKAGEKVSANFTKVDQNEPLGTPAEDITVTLNGPDVPQQSCVLVKAVAVGAGCGFKDVVATKSGVWKVEFKLPETAKIYPEVSPTVRWGANHFSWSVTVADQTGEKPGRIWSERYAIRQPIQPEFQTDLIYHYMSESGYLYRASYKGYHGQISSLSADGIGIRENKTCKSAYQSIPVNDTKMSPSSGSCGASYKLFFEQPSGELPQTARRWDDVTEWIRPSVNRPSVADLQFVPDDQDGQQSGTISFRLKNFVGQYEIKIDVDNDGNYNSSQDVSIKRSIQKLSTEPQEVRFNGVTTDSQPIPRSQPIGVKIEISKVAEIHLVNADVEGRTGGLELVRLSGDNAPAFGMCWNDTNLDAVGSVAFTTKKLDGRDCASSSGGVHGWGYGTGSWGDIRYIDDWANAEARVEGVMSIVYPDTAADAAAGTGTMSTPRQMVGAIIAVVTVILVVVGILVYIVIHKRKRQPQQFEPPRFS